MGYHSYINRFIFKSILPEKKLTQAWDRFISELTEDNRNSMNQYYGFDYQGSEGRKLHKYVLWVKNDEAGRYEDAELLAMFVSSVIAQKTHTLIEVETGSNEMWGYLVVPGKIYDLNYSVTIDVSGMPLEEFLKSLKEPSDEN